MRWMLPLLLPLLAACSDEARQAGRGHPLADGQWAGEGRDRLCVSGARAGFVAYGLDDKNCSVRGKLAVQSGAVAIIPAGDADCRIPLHQEDGVLRLGERTAACAYYCGPGVDFGGRSFRPAPGAPRSVADLAGDPLC